MLGSLVEDPNVEHASLPACYRRWCNLKKAYATHTRQKKQPAGIAELLAALHQPQPAQATAVSRHH